MQNQRVCLLSLLGSCVLLALSGCGPGRGDLSGTVTYKGKKLSHGHVSVVGSDNVPKAGTIEKDGTYLVKDIPTGAVKIGVSSPDPASIKVAIRIKEKPPPPPDRTGWFEIPEKYADPQKSGLTFNVNSGANSHEIKLD